MASLDAHPPSLDEARREILKEDLNDAVIAVICSVKSAAPKTDDIVNHFVTSLEHDSRHLIRLDDAQGDWLERAKEAGCTKWIFAGLPPLPKRGILSRKGSSTPGLSPDREFVPKGRWKTNDVVVIQSDVSKRSSRKGPEHYLDRFIQLDVTHEAKWLAEAALSVFAAPEPIACDEDDAYWSRDPKLVEVEKEANSSLGLSIMTREMDISSRFGRVVLLKSFNHDCAQVLRDRLGKYTHIQVVNGVLLDGLAIEQVTAIFQSLHRPRVQLLVRYIHPKQPKKLKNFPNRQSTGATFKKQRTSIDVSGEVLPLPLYILGDNFSLCNSIFQLLSRADDLPPGANDTGSIHSPSVASPMSNHEHPDPSDMRHHEAEAGDVATPIKVVQKDIATAASKRRFSLSLKDLSQSDKCVERALVPPKKFDTLPDLDKDPSIDSAETPETTRSRPPHLFTRSLSTRPEVAECQYILQMLKKDVDRQFAHLFLRSSGLYLIVMGLEDIVYEPLIQYENLSYWLRLIHTHVRPEEVKQVVVVGTYQKSEVQQQGDMILQCVTHLNAIIREQMKKVYGIPMKEKGYVFMFDRDQQVIETQYLCACIRSLTNVFMDQVWYWQKEFFYTVFQPFEHFKKVCASLVQVQDKPVLSNKEVQKLYAPRQLPDSFFETLSAYSSAYISLRHKVALLQPSLLPGLLQSCTSMTHQDYQVFFPYFGNLKGLPIINAPLLTERMRTIGNATPIIRCMKELEVIYSLDEHPKEETETFFVPFLATEVVDNPLSKWDEVQEAEFSGNGVVTLYVSLPSHATEHVFYRLIASVLTDAIASRVVHVRYFIKLGCKEAMLPLFYGDNKSPGKVLLKYHPLQNFIELRKQESQPLQLLKAVESKLARVFGEGRGAPVNPNISFHIPAESFSRSTQESTLWMLGRLGLSGEEDGEDDEVILRDSLPEKLLLKTKFLTTSSSTKTQELRNWASSDPSMKKLPSELYLSLQKKLSTSDHHWTLVGSKLGVLTTDDINFFRTNPYGGGNGGVVLDRWAESPTKTYADLIAVLKDPEVGLNQTAEDVERFLQRS